MIEGSLNMQAARCDAAAARIRQRLPSHRNRLILAALSLRAKRLRKLSAADTTYPMAAAPPRVFTTYTPPAPYRVFRVIRNPAAGRLTRNRRLTHAGLRLVKGDS